MGSVINLDWTMPDRSVLIIIYENAQTTQQQVDASSDWMLKNTWL